MKTRTARNTKPTSTISTAALVRAAFEYKREITSMRRSRTQKIKNGIACLFGGKFDKAASIDNEVELITMQINERILRVKTICKTLRERPRSEIATTVLP